MYSVCVCRVPTATSNSCVCSKVLFNSCCNFKAGPHKNRKSILCVCWVPTATSNSCVCSQVLLNSCCNCYCLSFSSCASWRKEVCDLMERFCRYDPEINTFCVTFVPSSTALYFSIKQFIETILYRCECGDIYCFCKFVSSCNCPHFQYEIVKPDLIE